MNKPFGPEIILINHNYLAAFLFRLIPVPCSASIVFKSAKNLSQDAVVEIRSILEAQVKRVLQVCTTSGCGKRSQLSFNIEFHGVFLLLGSTNINLNNIDASIPL